MNDKMVDDLNPGIELKDLDQSTKVNTDPSSNLLENGDVKSKNSNSLKCCLKIFILFTIVIAISFFIFKDKIIAIIKNIIDGGKPKRPPKNKINYANLVESLCETDGNNILLKKDLLNSINSFVACLGPPWAGKNTFSLFYKYKYNFTESYFEASNSLTTFTKGLWVLKQDERRKCPAIINRDIIDVEGFQIEEVKSWKYIMAVSFLSTDILLLNRDARYDNVNKILKIIGTSLRKMKEGGIPRMLKSIFIQVIEEDDIPKFNSSMAELNFKKEDFIGINLIPFYLPSIRKKELKKYYDGEIEYHPEYRENLLKVLDILTPEGQSFSVTSLEEYIDNFNRAINGKNGFDQQAIFNDMRLDFEGVYKRYEAKKISELLNFPLPNIKSLNETFDEYIDRLNLNFSFGIKWDELTFFGSANVYDDFYKSLGENKSFTISNELLRNGYNNLYKIKECENEENKRKVYASYEANINEIDNYFNQLRFFDYIEPYCRYIIDTNIPEEFHDFRNKYQKDLESYYEQKVISKMSEWKNQITRAKWKNAIQACGELRCVNGHIFSDDFIYHGKCGMGSLFWVDGPNHYVICKNCGEVFKFEPNLVCSGCLGKS